MAVSVDASKRRRRGPKPMPESDRRVHTVSVRVSSDELALLDERRAAVHMQRGEYMRAAALHRLPRVIPAINRQAWAELARVGSNLNQITRYVNANKGLGNEIISTEIITQIAECRRLLAQVRAGLIGADVGADVED